MILAHLLIQITTCDCTDLVVYKHCRCARLARYWQNTKTAEIEPCILSKDTIIQTCFCSVIQSYRDGGSILITQYCPNDQCHS